MRTAARAGSGSGAGSRRPNTPSRANTKPARPSRTRWASAEITAARWTASQPPGGMQRNHAAGEHAVAHPAKARRRDHVGEGLRAREPADGFDEITIRIGIARHRAAERRNDVEGI